jgi:hypothetical protein
MHQRLTGWLLPPATILLLTAMIWILSSPRSEGADSSWIQLDIGESTEVPVADVGSVLLHRTRAQLEIGAVTARPDYRARVVVRAAAGQFVEAVFTGRQEQVSFAALLHGNRVTIKVTSESVSVSTGADSSSPSTTRPMTTSTAITTSTTTTTLAPTTTEAPPTTAAPAPTNPPTITAPTTTTTTTPTTTAPVTTTTTLVPKIPDGSVSYSLGPAGTVIVAFQSQEFSEIDVDLAPGWKLDDSRIEPEVLELELKQGDLRVIWAAHILAGQVVVHLQVIEDD